MKQERSHIQSVKEHKLIVGIIYLQITVKYYKFFKYNYDVMVNNHQSIIMHIYIKTTNAPTLITFEINQ